MVSLLLPVIYLAFISLGLPDALLGAAWPSMYLGLGAGLSWAGMISMIISAGTVVSSLASDALTARLGPGRVTAISVGTTAAALFGFSTCTAKTCPAYTKQKTDSPFRKVGLTIKYPRPCRRT